MPKYSITIDYYAEKPILSDNHFEIKEGKNNRPIIGFIRDVLRAYMAREQVKIIEESKTVKR